MKPLYLSIIAVAGIAVIGIILFAVILPSQPKKIEGLDEDTGIVTIGIQSYYFTTVNDTMTTVRGEDVQELFHNVVFTFFPSPAYMGPIGSCGGITFGSDAKFSDGAHELLQVPLFGSPCGKDYFQTDLSNHTNPQAGLAVYDEKIKLLVSTKNESSAEMRGMTGIGLTVVTPYDYIAHGGRSAVIIEPLINQVNLTRGKTTTVDLHVRHLAGTNPFPFVYVTPSPPYGNIWYPPALASSTTPEQRIHAEESGKLISGSVDLGTLVSFQEKIPIKIAAGGEEVVKMYVSVPATLGDEFVGQGTFLSIPIKAVGGDTNSTILSQAGGVNFFIVK
ncbi:MAG: hypothetical protein HY223_08535 [Thaumarchaeota archaeon]|nr:hypothetical protein [Nitrososphaerota archaeon]